MIDIDKHRADLAHVFTHAGTAMADFNCAACAVIEIPGTDPQRYAAIGTAADIIGQLQDTPAATSGNAATDDQWMFDLAAEYESRSDSIFGSVTFSARKLPEFVNAVLARAAVSAATKPTADLSKLRELAEFWSGKYHSSLRPVREGHEEAWGKVVAYVQSLLATKPAAPAVPNVDDLAQLIRKVDGNHSMGAGMLAEKIVEWLAAAGAEGAE